MPVPGRAAARVSVAAERGDLAALSSQRVLRAAAIVFGFFAIFVLAFSRQLTAGRLLAPGDGMIMFVPLFRSHWTLWTDLVQGGFPAAADPLAASWYPLALLMRSVPGGWNLYIISAYVLAAVFAWGYLRTLTGSWLAALIGALIFSMSGFMMSHMGHAPIIHSAAWLPLMIWALEELRRKIFAGWFVIAALALANCALAGHPQIALYSAGLSAAYVLVLGGSAAAGRWKYYLVCATAALCGLGLSAIQIIPTAQLGAFSVRAHPDYLLFISYALRRIQLVSLLFPYVFGGSPAWHYAQPAFGDHNIIELTGFVGVTGLLLATVGASANRRETIAKFWFWAAVIAVLLALGNKGPFAKLTFHVPLYNRLRVPARHFLEFAMALSALAAMGVAALEQRRVPLGQKVRVVGVWLAVIAVAMIAIVVRLPNMGPGTRTVASLMPWAHPATGIPLVVFIVGAAWVLAFAGRHDRGFARALLLALVVIDLGSYFWFIPDMLSCPEPSTFAAPPYALKYGATLRASGQRMLPIDGSQGPLTEIPPLLSRLWGVPSASTYDELTFASAAALLSMHSWGGVDRSLLAPTDRGLDLISCRYVFTPSHDMEHNGSPDTASVRSGRWREVEQIGQTTVLENLHAMPRAWMVRQVITVAPDQILTAIRTSRLPDGRPFDPALTALVAEPLKLEGARDPVGTVRILNIQDTAMELETHCAQPSFLVTSDMYYPGWRAWVDGERVTIYRADYALRGVMLPAGDHHVRFAFRPMSLSWGIAISALALIALGAVFVLAPPRFP